FGIMSMLVNPTPSSFSRWKDACRLGSQVGTRLRKRNTMAVGTAALALTPPGNYRPRSYTPHLREGRWGGGNDQVISDLDMIRIISLWDLDPHRRGTAARSAAQ